MYMSSSKLSKAKQMRWLSLNLTW